MHEGGSQAEGTRAAISAYWLLWEPQDAVSRTHESRSTTQPRAGQGAGLLCFLWSPMSADWAGCFCCPLCAAGGRLLGFSPSPGFHGLCRPLGDARARILHWRLATQNHLRPKSCIAWPQPGHWESAELRPPGQRVQKHLEVGAEKGLELWSEEAAGMSAMRFSCGGAHVKGIRGRDVQGPAMCNPKEVLYCG